MISPVDIYEFEKCHVKLKINFFEKRFVGSDFVPKFESMTSKIRSSEKKPPLLLFVVLCMKSLVELCGRNAKKKGKKLQMERT